MAVGGVGVVVALLAGGFANAAFYILAALDFLTGARLWGQMPALMWAVWGLVFGAALAFWLDAPLYGLRRQRWMLLVAPVPLLLIGALVTLSLRPVSAWPPDPVAPPPPPPPPPNFAGTWDTGRWGTMTLAQEGSHVYGTYTYSNGIIEGTVAPGTSRFTYRWRNQSGGASGVGYFDLASDARSFAGKYVNGETLTEFNGDDWSARRTAWPPPPPVFTGTWETNWGEMKLSQGVKTANGTYEYGGGTMEGTMDGMVFRFRWLNRVTGESGSGKFTLAPDGRSFQGTWNTGKNPDAPGESWTGQKKDKAE